MEQPQATRLDLGSWDLDNPHLKWGSAKSRLVRMADSRSPDSMTYRDLASDFEWKEFLIAYGGNLNIDAGEQKLNLILLGRADDDPSVHNPALLSYLPCGKDVFRKIARDMRVYGSVKMTIDRGNIARFNKTLLTRTTEGVPAIVYNFRSANSWPGDMALSLTYIPSKHCTYAVFYGCSQEAIREITERLSAIDDNCYHPLLLPSIFVELERKRHSELVNNGLNKRVQFLANLLQNKTYDWKSRADDEEDTSTTDSVELWMDICHLRNGLEKWKQLLSLIAAHADELSHSYFASPLVDSYGGLGKKQGGLQVDVNSAMRNVGIKIRERLIEISLEYDGEIRECDMIMDGMAMATQLAHAKANMEITMRTRRDGRVMLAIGALTACFLPSTFVATLFSMPFFTVQPEGELALSSSLWIYAVFSVALTVGAFGVWGLVELTSRRKRNKDARRRKTWGDKVV